MMNTKMTQSLMSLALAATLTAAGPAHTASAAVMYSYATDVSNVTLSPGQMHSVNLYLIETTTNGSPSPLATEDGLFGSYVDVTFMPASPALANPSFISGLAANTADFNDPTSPEMSPPSPTFVYLRQITDVLAPSGPTGAEISAGVRQVYLGSVTVTGGTSGGVTTFRVGDDPAHIDTLTFNGTVIDGTPGIAPATFTVTIPIPEPTAAALVGLLACAAPGRRRRR